MLYSRVLFKVQPSAFNVTGKFTCKLTGMRSSRTQAIPTACLWCIQQSVVVRARCIKTAKNSNTMLLMSLLCRRAPLPSCVFHSGKTTSFSDEATETRSTLYKGREGYILSLSKWCIRLSLLTSKYGERNGKETNISGLQEFFLLHPENGLYMYIEDDSLYTGVPHSNHMSHTQTHTQNLLVHGICDMQTTKFVIQKCHRVL